MASGVSIRDSKRPFACGVCEGFYGKPWTTDQRKELFIRMQRMGLTTYLYAPKDDYKHRLYWRELYGEDEADDLKELIDSARSHGVNFVYAISPGLDITFSNKNDVSSLKSKLDQVKKFGCESFALLFDDIDSDLGSGDEGHFKSPADAQSQITNEVFMHLGEPACFLFCPTEYCASRAVPDVDRSRYLETLGDKLDKRVDILWTGPKVVSKTISVESIKAVSRKIKRPPVIWDNIHANDYDQTRVYLGPYDGRPGELVDYLNGVLTNPNCEFEANFVAMHTLAQWSNDRVENYPPIPEDGSPPDVDMVEPDRGPLNQYQPHKALIRAVEDWLPEFYKIKGVEDSRKKRRTRSGAKTRKRDKAAGNQGNKQTSDNLDMESKLKKRMADLEPLEVEDVVIFCDLHYLPFGHGPRAIHMLKRAHWLVSNIDKVKDGVTPLSKSEQDGEAKEWYEKAIHFHDCFKGLAIVVDKFVNSPNRAILYDIYAYVSDMRSALSLVNSYVKWIGMGKPPKEPFNEGEQEPWIFRGGLLAEFRRLLPLEGQNDMFPLVSRLPTASQVYTIRPYFPEDKSDVYVICQRTYEIGFDECDITVTYPDLFSDACVGPMLEFSQSLCYVLEDNAGIIGYATAVKDVRGFQERVSLSWIPKMKEKYPKKDLENYEDICPFHAELRPIPDELYQTYPSFVHLHLTHSKMGNIEQSKKLLNCTVKVLKSLGSVGFHTTIDANHIGLLSFYMKLGFIDITDDKNAPGEMLVLGKVI